VEQVDIAIVGAGIAGLTCAQVLHQAGYTIAILEKSRGVGGRLATRRLHNTRADHGTCYLSPKGELFRKLMQTLVERDIVQTWTDSVYELSSVGTLQPPAKRSPRYVAPDGMNAIAKFLSPSLDIRFNQRVIRVEPTRDQTWQLTIEETAPEATYSTLELTAKALIVAIPAPQAVEILSPLQTLEQLSPFFAQLKDVQFSPCIAVMAGYPNEELAQWQTQYSDVKAIAPNHPDLAWIGLDSSKRRVASQPVFVLQSTAQFAQIHLEASDLTPVGRSLLKTAAKLLLPWLANPEWLQVHRWRYAFPTRPLPSPYLMADTLAPLLCAGDWCNGARVEDAFHSGLEAAHCLNQHLSDLPISRESFWGAIVPH